MPFFDVRKSLPEAHVGYNGGTIEIGSILSASHESPTEREQPETLVLQSPEDFRKSEVFL